MSSELKRSESAGGKSSKEDVELGKHHEVRGARRCGPGVDQTSRVARLSTMLLQKRHCCANRTYGSCPRRQGSTSSVSSTARGVRVILVHVVLAEHKARHALPARSTSTTTSSSLGTVTASHCAFSFETSGHIHFVKLFVVINIRRIVGIEARVNGIAIVTESPLSVDRDKSDNVRTDRSMASSAKRSSPSSSWRLRWWSRVGARGREGDSGNRLFTHWFVRRRRVSAIRSLR